MAARTEKEKIVLALSLCEAALKSAIREGLSMDGEGDCWDALNEVRPLLDRLTKKK